jgi:hypothetical protein
LSPIVSFGDILWVDDQGETWPCDWLGRTRVFVCDRSEFLGYGVILANHSAVFLHDHQTAEFHQMKVSDDSGWRNSAIL